MAAQHTIGMNTLGGNYIGIFGSGCAAMIDVIGFILVSHDACRGVVWELTAFMGLPRNVPRASMVFHNFSWVVLIVTTAAPHRNIKGFHLSLIHI